MLSAPDQMEMVGHLARNGAGKDPCRAFPGWAVISLKHACVVRALYLKHTLLNFPVKSKCPWCLPKPSGGAVPSGWLPVTGTPCAACGSK